jgi:DNA polymerase-3 subunit delta'
MGWQWLRGHTQAVAWFQRAAARGRLGGSFLFVGPEGVGKRCFALELARSLLCQRTQPQRLEACGQCPACQQVAAGTHPDLLTVAKPPDKVFLPLELLIGDAEHRMRDGLCYHLALRPLAGHYRVAIIDDADDLNKEGANCLLKTLEEPPPHALLILIGTSPQRQLPTIRSRCQIVRFAPLETEVVAELLRSTGQCSDPDLARLAAERSGGSLTQARWWCDREALAFRRQMLQHLAPLVDVPAATRLATEFVEGAGKESAVRRQRLKLVLGLGQALFHAVLRQQETGTSSGDVELAEASQIAAGQMPPGAAADCLEVGIQALAAVEANASPVLVIEWWLDELAQTILGGHRPSPLATLSHV